MIVAPSPFAVSKATPTLAWLIGRIGERPFYFVREPYPVEQKIFTAAENEMYAILKMRGWSDVPRDGNIGHLTRERSDEAPVWVGRPNFLLMGTPIVLEQ